MSSKLNRFDRLILSFRCGDSISMCVRAYGAEFVNRALEWWRKVPDHDQDFLILFCIDGRRTYPNATDISRYMRYRQSFIKTLTEQEKQIFHVGKTDNNQNMKG